MSSRQLCCKALGNPCHDISLLYTFPFCEECKVFRRLGIHATFYTDEDMLRRFPLRPPAQFGGNSNRGGDDDDEVPPGAECALCGKDDKQEDMTRTRCCNQVGYYVNKVGSGGCLQSARSDGMSRWVRAHNLAAAWGAHFASCSVQVKPQQKRHLYAC